MPKKYHVALTLPDSKELVQHDCDDYTEAILTASALHILGGEDIRTADNIEPGRQDALIIISEA